MLPATSGAAPTRSFAHDVKVFHEVSGQGSRPLPAQIAVLVGGKAQGKLVSGKGSGKRFVIADVKGAKLVLNRHTGLKARISLDLEPTCRANPEARYYIRASAVIRGKTHKAFVQGDCRFVLQVLANNSNALVQTTFIFEN